MPPISNLAAAMPPSDDRLHEPVTIVGHKAFVNPTVYRLISEGSDSMRYTLSSMQDPGTLRYFHHINEVMSGCAELHFLQDDGALPNPDHEPPAPRRRVAAPCTFRA